MPKFLNINLTVKANAHLKFLVHRCIGGNIHRPSCLDLQIADIVSQNVLLL